MRTIAKLPHLIPPFYTLQAYTTPLLSQFVLVLDYGDQLLDCGGHHVDRDRDQRGGRAVQKQDVIVGGGAGFGRFLRRRALVEAEMCEGGDEEMAGVGN